MPLRDRLIARPAVLGRLSRPVAPLANAVMHTRAGRRVVEATLGLHRDAAAARLLHAHLPVVGAAHPAAGRSATRTVVYFHGCAANYNEPRVARMAVEVLEHNGFRVIVPPQGCCGLPLQSNGGIRAGPELRARAGRPAGAVRPRGPHDRRQLDQLRPDAEARGARHPRHRRPRPGARRASARSTSASSCATSSTPASCAPTCARCRCACPTTSPARAAATASASPPSTCCG